MEEARKNFKKAEHAYDEARKAVCIAQEREKQLKSECEKAQYAYRTAKMAASKEMLGGVIVYYDEFCGHLLFSLPKDHAWDHDDKIPDSKWFYSQSLCRDPIDESSKVLFIRAGMNECAAGHFPLVKQETIRAIKEGKVKIPEPEFDHAKMC